MKILLFVPDTISIRNYLYSNFITELEKNNAEVILYHNILDEAVAEIQKINRNIQVQRIPNFIENPKARLLRESIAFARLLRNKKTLKNSSILHFWLPKNNNFKQKVLYKWAEIIGFGLSKSYKLILRAEKNYENEISKSKLIPIIENDFEILKPDFVLNLHQRTPISSLVVNVAKKRSIPTATVIFSWDNIPKARLISRYDNYFVWSELMKNELKLLYPELDENAIKVTGTPQFEFYFQEKYFRTRSEFFNEFGLNPDKKTICFSANDLSSPYEQHYFDDLCSEIAKIDEKSRPQILFRNCPVDNSNRFDASLEKYKSFVFAIAPDWKTDNQNTIYPTINDFLLLANTVKHSDLVINLGSTMAHDFAVFDKPCLYLNYNPVENSKFKVEDVFAFQHFRSMQNLDAVGWINSKDDFIPKITETLNDPNKIGIDRNLWMQQIVHYPLEKSSERLANQILELCTSVS